MDGRKPDAIVHRLQPGPICRGIGLICLEDFGLVVGLNPYKRFHGQELLVLPMLPGHGPHGSASPAIHPDHPLIQGNGHCGQAIGQQRQGHHHMPKIPDQVVPESGRDPVQLIDGQWVDHLQEIGSCLAHQREGGLDHMMGIVADKVRCPRMVDMDPTVQRYTQDITGTACHAKLPIEDNITTPD